MLEDPLLLGLGVRERPLLVSEELALDQLLRQGGAVDPEERGEGGGIALVHQVMDVPGEDLLPGPALARDEDHRDAGGGELPALLLQLVDLVPSSR